MARYRRRDAIEERVSDRVEAEGRAFTADLIAKRATAVEGYRMTLALLELDGEGSFFVDLEAAESREEAQRRAAELREDPSRVRDLLARELGAGETAPG